MPTVSIITPTYNSAAFVRDTIESVQAQTFEDWEMHIVDDCSTDDTMDVLRTMADADPRLKITRLPDNSGPAVARNTGITNATGRYIAFVDADDMWLPQKLERQLAFMRERGSPFSYTGYDKIDESGNRIGERIVPASITYNRLLANNVIGCLTAMYDTQLCGKVLMPLIRKRQDLGLWLHLLRTVGRADGMTETLALYRVRSGSVSSNKLVAAHYTWKVFREVENIPYPKAAFYFALYAIGGVLRR
jgi:glycosyltransferase involved in cell wall biosynthesis